MVVIAISIVIASVVGALAYAVPKLYWYHLQNNLINIQLEDERKRFELIKSAHDGQVIADRPKVVLKGDVGGQYL